jgi:hypothetical protein
MYQEIAIDVQYLYTIYIINLISIDKNVSTYIKLQSQTFIKATADIQKQKEENSLRTLLFI